MEPLKIELILGDDEFKRKLAQSERYARDTKKKLDQNAILKMRVNNEQIKGQIDDVKRLLKSKNLTHPEKIELRVAMDKLKKDLSEGKRSLRNYLNTGDENLSRFARSFKLTSKSIVGGVTKMFGALGIALGLREAVQRLDNITDKAANLQSVKTSFDQLTASAGESGDAILAAIRKASDGTVSNYDMMLSANKAYSLGVAENTEEFTTLMEIARKKGTAMGLDTKKAFDDIVTGLGRASPLILDNLGIVVKIGEVNENYAKSLGKTVKELTEQEKKQALVNAVISQGREEIEATGRATVGVKEMKEQLAASIENVTTSLGERFLPALTDGIGWVKGFLESFEDIRPSLFAEQVNQARDSVRGLKDELKDNKAELRYLIQQFIEGAMYASDLTEQTKKLYAAQADLEGSLKRGTMELKEWKIKNNEAEKVQRIHTSAVENYLKRAQEQNISMKEQNETIANMSREHQILIEQIRTGEVTHKGFFNSQIMIKKGSRDAAEGLVDLQIATDNVEIATKNADAAFAELSTASSQKQFDALKIKVLETLRILAIAQEGFASQIHSTMQSTQGGMLNVGMINKQKQALSQLAQTRKKITEINIGDYGDSNFSGATAPSGRTTPPRRSRGGGGGSRTKKKKKKEKTVAERKKEMEDHYNNLIQVLGKDEDARRRNADKILLLEEQKNEKIKEIEGKTTQAIIDAAKKAHDEKKQKIRDYYDAINDKIEESKKKIKDYAKEIKDLTKSLEDLEKEQNSELSDRYIDIQKTLKENRRENTMVDTYANMYSLNTLESMYNAGADNINGRLDIQKLIEHKKMMQELTLLQSELTEEQRKSAEEYDKLSDTEKMLQKHETEKNIIEEKLAEKKQALAEEESIHENFTNAKIKMEKRFTNALQTEIEKQKDSINSLIASLSRLSRAQAAAHSATASTIQTNSNNVVNQDITINNQSDLSMAEYTKRLSPL